MRVAYSLFVGCMSLPKFQELSPTYLYIHNYSFLNTWHDQFMDRRFECFTEVLVWALTCILSDSKIGMLHSCEGAEV